MTALSIAELKKLQSKAWSRVREQESVTSSTRAQLAAQESQLRADRSRAEAFDDAIAALEKLGDA